jgi:hypothetical protein
LLTEGRKYGILHGIRPGTQRVRLWGFPKFASAYGRASSFCGDQGVEWFEPLSFKGRKGSGKPGGRCGYADASLNPKYDFQKFAYTYRVWGRCIYNPDADPEQWRRWLRSEFGDGASHAEEALANASRILPVITTIHGASGSNNTYWPEMYTNMPIVDENRKQPYSDTPKPKRFGMSSAFDPQIFANAHEFVGGKAVDKISPIQTAVWLEELSKRANEHLAKLAPKDTPEFRRWQLDVAIQAGIGQFFADKLRAAVDWQKGETGSAIQHYTAARNAWAKFAEMAKDRYASDITYGPPKHMRGHWMDRLADIDGDLADMKKAEAKASHPGLYKLPAIRAQHAQPARFRKGEPLDLTLQTARGKNAARLYYRHVNQAEHWKSVEMRWSDGLYRGSVPAEYTESPFPLEYYFVVDGGIYPGFGPELSGTPYFVVRA